MFNKKYNTDGVFKLLKYFKSKKYFCECCKNLKYPLLVKNKFDLLKFQKRILSGTNKWDIKCHFERLDIWQSYNLKILEISGRFKI